MDISQAEKTLQKLRQVTQASVRKDLKSVISTDFDTQLVDSVASNWKKGIKGNGDIIGGYRSDAYRAMKEAMNPMAGGNVDLIYEGDFVSSLFFDNTTNKLIDIDASDSKRGKLVGKYGEGIFEVSDDIEKEVIDDAVEEVYKIIGERIFNG